MSVDTQCYTSIIIYCLGLIVCYHKDWDLHLFRRVTDSFPASIGQGKRRQPLDQVFGAAEFQIRLRTILSRLSVLGLDLVPEQIISKARDDDIILSERSLEVTCAGWSVVGWCE